MSASKSVCQGLTCCATDDLLQSVDDALQVRRKRLIQNRRQLPLKVTGYRQLQTIVEARIRERIDPAAFHDDQLWLGGVRSSVAANNYLRLSRLTSVDLLFWPYVRRRFFGPYVRRRFFGFTKGREFRKASITSRVLPQGSCRRRSERSGNTDVSFRAQARPPG
jgi:hypothetical protein